MSWEPYVAVFNQLFVPEILLVFALTFAIAALYSAAAKLSLGVVFGFSIPFGFLGATSGVIAGATAEPIVGAFLTGLLGIVSGILSLLLAKEVAKPEGSSVALDIQQLAGPAIVVLCLAALGGLAIGRVYQTDWINFDRSYAETKDLNEKVNMPIAKLLKQHEFCLAKAKNPASCDSILLETK